VGSAGRGSIKLVGLNWQVASFADFNHDGMTDLMLRNSSTGGFEVYDISNNSIKNAAALGTVGLNWQAGGFDNFRSLVGTDDLAQYDHRRAFEVYNIANNKITGATLAGRRPSDHIDRITAAVPDGTAADVTTVRISRVGATIC
jgi:hypothetical protein